jgi:hypothetical protein
VVVKQAYGVAGNGALRLFEPELLAAQTRWMAGALARGQELVVEPWLERLEDFSVQLEMTPEGLKLRGYTGLVNDARGQFEANFADGHHQHRLPARVAAWFEGRGDMAGRLWEYYERLFEALAAELRAADFLGPLGIDALVYGDGAGRARLKPVVEINPRYTMGRVLVELMRQTSQNSAGVLRLVSASRLPADLEGSLLRYAGALEAQFPLRLEDGPAPRIREGALTLNDPAAARSCLAVFQVGRTLDSLLPRAERRPASTSSG